MPLFLAGLLSRDGVLPGRLVEEALQRQVLAGGALDSSLLELGAIDEAQLGVYLSRASGLPLANTQQLAAPEQRLRRLFPLRLAERHGLVPFAQGERTLQMACAYPADAALLEEMGFLLSQRIEAWVAPEFRVRLAIERLYGHPASARMHELARRCGAEVSTAQLPPADKPPVDPERCLAPDWTVAEALSRLEAATDRDEAIAVALRFGRRTFAYVALFGVVGGNAVGWDAVGEEPGAEHRVEQVVQPLSEETVLATVVRTQGRYLGPLARTEANERLVERMGRPVPRSAFVHPVEVGGRLVALVWADNGAAAVPAEAAGEAMVVVQTLGQTLERLVRERKAAIAASADTHLEREAASVATAAAHTASGKARPAATVAGSSAPAASAPAASAPAASAPAASAPAASAPAASAQAARTPAASTPAASAPAASAQAANAPAASAPAAAAAGAGGVVASRDAATDPAADQVAEPTPAEAVNEFFVPGPYPGAETAAERAAASPAGKATTDRFLGKGTRSVAITGLQQACRGAEALLHAVSDAERAEALARVAGSGSIGAEVLVALLPGPLRTDASGALSGGVILDALAALGPWAVPGLSRAATSPSSAVRYWVAVLLASSADPTGHAALARLANDTDPHVAAVARTAVQPAA